VFCGAVPDTSFNLDHLIVSLSGVIKVLSLEFSEYDVSKSRAQGKSFLEELIENVSADVSESQAQSLTAALSQPTPEDRFQAFSTTALSLIAQGAVAWGLPQLFEYFKSCW
jgi:hypothetical protein